MVLNRLISTVIDFKHRKATESPMLFLTGPRQVGKTFLARQLDRPYFNWDTREVKRAFLEDPYFFRGTQGWIIFDEIHKRRDWKKLLKGCYDSPERGENFFVTGSGRFQLYQKGGDSLQGRYDLFHLYPLTVREAIGFSSSYELRVPEFEKFAPGFPLVPQESALLRYGGFPEPFLRTSDRFLNKWQDLYLQRLIQEDVRDFSRVTALDKLEMMIRLLPSRTQSPISFQSLAEDIETSRETVKAWFRLLEILYMGFWIRPFSRKIHRSVKKEAKWYFFQWTFNETAASIFENYVASQLLTACQLWRDAGLGVFELFYVRDQDRREVDFLITKNLRPQVLIEAKVAADVWPSSLDFYAKKMQIPAFLVTREGPIRSLKGGRWIVPSSEFFQFIL